MPRTRGRFVGNASLSGKSLKPDLHRPLLLAKIRDGTAQAVKLPGAETSSHWELGCTTVLRTTVLARMICVILKGVTGSVLRWCGRGWIDCIGSMQLDGC